MIDVFRVADALVTHALANHRDEIDLIGYYGSRARGDARPTSDLDIFYTPADGTDPPVAATFLLDGILFDFWPIGWATLEGFATGRSRGWAVAPAVVEQISVLHARSEAVVKRLQDLREKTRELTQASAAPTMLQRALTVHSRVRGHLDQIQGAARERDLSGSRDAGWKLVESAIECIALANQAYFDAGMLKGLTGLHVFERRPPCMEATIDVIATSSDAAAILQAAERFEAELRTLLRSFQRANATSSSVGPVFRGGYPELKDLIGKLTAACARGDTVGAHWAAWCLQSEIIMMLDAASTGAGHARFNRYRDLASLYLDLDFPDLLGHDSRSLVDLSRRVQELDVKLRGWLQNQSVDLCEFGTLDELEQFLATR